MKYIFTAKYKDGTEYVQNQEDISLTEPLKSCYFDVKQDELSQFVLEGEGHTYLVDLTDGHFEIDGVSFLMHEDNYDLKDFRLIFWRRHTHSFNQENGKELSHDIVYRFGWQTTIEDKNYQRIMQIK